MGKRRLDGQAQSDAVRRVFVRGKVVVTIALLDLDTVLSVTEMYDNQ
jgi:hypothetical protein